MQNEYSFEDIYIKHSIDEHPDAAAFRMHIHDRCEIYFFVSGDVEYLVEGTKYPLMENSLMILRPAESHKPNILSEKRYERYSINFPISFVDAIDPQGVLTRAFSTYTLGKNNMLGPSDIDMSLVRRLFSDMCREEDDGLRRLTIKTHLPMLLYLIARAYAKESSDQAAPQGADARIVMYVNAHLFEDISVLTLAKHFYMSTSQFSRIFKRATGASPWEYITQKRLTAAKEMIRHTHPAQKASEHCGFRDYSSFYRAYHKHFGHAPTEDIGIAEESRMHTPSDEQP